MTSHFVTPETRFIVLSFLTAYLLILIFRTRSARLDVVDFCVLSSLAIVVAVFIEIPQIGIFFSQISGVRFPFLILYGGLFLLIYLIFFRIFRILQDQRLKLTALTQYSAILENRIVKLEAERLNSDTNSHVSSTSCRATE